MWQKNKSINIYQLCIMDQSGYTEKAAGIHNIIMLLTYFLDNVLWDHTSSSSRYIHHVNHLTSAVQKRRLTQVYICRFLTWSCP